MRVISGKVRGLKLNTPKNDDVRPTTDRVKESLFNVINQYIMESTVLDLFAGTGSLGIECLSRGAKKCVFVDVSKESIALVKSNIKKARVENESVVLNLDFKDAISRLETQNSKFDVIFMDPPYYKDMFINALEKIDNADLLDEDGIIVIEHDSKDDFPENIGRLEKSKSKKYGNTTLTFYKL
ncbi:16S rRNA (guanine(966)-N(2))-methyltransferase RsmD [Romboutsia lituseburensis]|uniref:16S rRNA (Guanine(966)-N(2))-methyltransferase RsmD n=1 Tax=Romboutsia lituseburensis DSM 797 TaxID=1121325 RepID=A0A1G9QB99_9FIRM|nr:16S rRNA (guanine(966)-N(2))-methyltransferase RsmD [Romboutsia lituseburensis]CEH35428.1 RNA methyltransferase, RsmD [Romboutsia lituseburensis]SDM08210.1 16S rRNA (guanine(966)-N(2))-methyltransferase RsmD [Romboutsia lituseburensis DSM 797]